MAEPEANSMVLRLSRMLVETENSAKTIKSHTSEIRLQKKCYSAPLGAHVWFTKPALMQRQSDQREAL
jgi:hypothetical protein